MKTLLLLLFLILPTIGAGQQKVVQDSSGNYIASRIIKPKPQSTGKIFTDSKGQVFVVHQTPGGKLYIIRKSKRSGKDYRYYLTPQ